MKKLEEYDTPISNEASYARWTNHAGIHCKTETDSVPVVVSRDLERKLAMCRDALRDCSRALKDRHNEQSYYSESVCAALYVATETLKATSPTTNS